MGELDLQEYGVNNSDTFINKQSSKEIFKKLYDGMDKRLSKR